MRQGDSISPTLFSIYLNDLAQEIKSLKCGIDVNGRNVNILLYADDIALIASSEKDLQSMLNVLFEWSVKWCINVNKKKSKIMHFRKENCECSKFTFKCGNNELDFVSSYKYLGATMNEFLKYDDNVDVLLKAALGSIIAKLKKQKFMGYSTFTKLYESCVCPVMEYASGVWGYPVYNKMSSVQQRAARCFLGLHRFSLLLAIEGDIGWLNPRFRRWLDILHLWNRLVKLPDLEDLLKIYLSMTGT